MNRIQNKFDLSIFIPMILLLVFGLLAIYSSTSSQPSISINFKKQLFFALVALLLFLIGVFVPFKFYKYVSLPSFIISLLLLIIVLFAGKTVYGAKSWMGIGSFGFQPSEFAKVGTILFLAHFLTNKRRDPNNVKDLFLIFGIISLPLILILLEPDMGTAIVYVIFTLTMLFWSGMDLFWFFLVLAPIFVVFASLFGLASLILALLFVIAALFYFKRNVFYSATILVMNIAAAFLFDYGLKFLKPHQQKRIETFVNPLADPLGAGYNILQAKVAIGSGGFLGKGFLEGNQTQLSYIPEQWTDFIYCVIGEEFGFLGAVTIIILFGIIFFRLLRIASQAKDRFSSLVVIGVAALFFAHFAINIGMNLGVAPVVGLPLPFLSYGGSSLIVNILLIGIVLNIYRNRKEHT